MQQENHLGRKVGEGFAGQMTLLSSFFSEKPGFWPKLMNFLPESETFPKSL